MSNRDARSSGRFVDRNSSIVIFWTSMSSETKLPLYTRRYVVRGRVQGVGFRWFVEREARTLGLYGWVRNNYDGSVEVLATGTREQLSSLRRKLQEGPRSARVDEVDESDAPPVEGLKTFRIEV